MNTILPIGSVVKLNDIQFPVMIFGFLQQNAANMGKTFPDMAIDTLAIARKFLPELPSRKLGDLCDHYQIREESWQCRSASPTGLSDGGHY